MLPNKYSEYLLQVSYIGFTFWYQLVRRRYRYGRDWGPKTLSRFSSGRSVRHRRGRDWGRFRCVEVNVKGTGTTGTRVSMGRGYWQKLSNFFRRTVFVRIDVRWDSGHQQTCPSCRKDWPNYMEGGALPRLSFLLLHCASTINRLSLPSHNWPLSVQI